MRSPPLILAVDDSPENLDLLRERLEAQGYAVRTAGDGAAALARAKELEPDLILLDVVMPGLDGTEVVRRLKADPDLPFIPVVLLTARSETRAVVKGLDAGADGYLAKPFDGAALLARVRAMLRLKEGHDAVRARAEALERRAGELAARNDRLEASVAEQGERIGRMDGLRRFLPREVADLLVSGADGGRDPLASHRRDVTVVFADLRGFTAFAEGAKPEEVMAVLRAYHAAVGELIVAHEGTLERFVGDGMVVLFNDPVPQADHAARALRLALAMRDRVAALADGWRRDGHDLGFGVGVARGDATLGGVGFEHRLEYAVIGTVPNLAARLCDRARDGQILLSERARAAADGLFEARPVGALSLKGFRQPVPAFELVGPRAGRASRRTRCRAGGRRAGRGASSDGQPGGSSRGGGLRRAGGSGWRSAPEAVPCPA